MARFYKQVGSPVPTHSPNTMVLQKMKSAGKLSWSRLSVFRSACCSAHFFRPGYAHLCRTFGTTLSPSA